MMTDKERIEELERRVRELESRPYWPTTIIYSDGHEVIS